MKNVILGLDMSTLSSGYSAFDSKKKLVDYGVWKQDKKVLWRDRCINMGNELSKLIDVCSPSLIYCEDTILNGEYRDWETDRKSTRLNSSHSAKSRMPSSA